MGKIIFALNEDGKTPSSWTIPQESVMAEKNDAGMKFINYYKGADTCFVEDITNKDLKPSKVPDFEFNTELNKTILEVDDTNLALLRYLKMHSWFGLRFVIYSNETEANSKLSQYEKVEKALELIKESDDIKIKAIALAILDLGYFYKTSTECLADLKSKAFNQPDLVIAEMEADDYQNKYVSALAFASGIIKNNMTNTAVVWSDNDGVIIHVAQGENGLNKLTEFLKRSTAESEVLLQEFQSRFDRSSNNKVNSSDTSSAQLKTNDDIKALKKMLANATLPKTVEYKEEETDVTDSTPIDYSTKTVEELQKLYVDIICKELPVRYKNDKIWITKELSK